jgi:hypothetical protein
VFAYFVIAAIVAVISSLALASRAVPRVLIWLGFVCAGLSLLAPAVSPMMLFPLWMMAVSIAMLLGSKESATVS